MRRADRLFQICQITRTGQPFTARSLAERLEVSERTVYRDIADLQASGIPIEGAAGFGYVALPGYELPALTFTVDQLEALALGAKFVIAAGDPDLAKAAAAARDKLEAALPETRRASLRESALLAVRRGQGKAPPLAAGLRRAIRDGLRVDLSYEDAAGSTTRRRVEPLALTAYTDGWLLGGWCLLRQGFRDFRLDRIRGMTVTAESFSPSAGRDLTAYRQHHSTSS
jgi:predicted DNA-binding transcriptional regulator YafY